MIDGLDDRLESFLYDKTYSWIIDIFQFNFNGYVKEIQKTKFLFTDDELGDIWINKNDVKNITYSKKKLEEKRNG